MSEFLKVYKIFYRCLTNVIIIFAVITAAAYLSGIRVYCVRSASMGDSVPLGSLCFVSTYTSYESIVPGDIIAFSACSKNRQGRNYHKGRQQYFPWRFQGQQESVFRTHLVFHTEYRSNHWIIPYQQRNNISFVHARIIIPVRNPL